MIFNKIKKISVRIGGAIAGLFVKNCERRRLSVYGTLTERSALDAQILITGRTGQLPQY